jgi:hypothetical protein
VYSRYDLTVVSILLSSQTLPSLLPEVGNGYIASVVMSDTIYSSGLFNGNSTVTPSHRARIQAFNVEVQYATQTDTAYALNMLEAVFYKRANMYLNDEG